VTRKAKPTRILRLITYGLAAAIVAAGFAMLMMRLEVIEEGYHLSVLKLQVRQLDNENQRLGLQEAELKSHQRLRQLAIQYEMGPPVPGQIMVVR
jgi:cell division protein FtsL